MSSQILLLVALFGAPPQNVIQKNGMEVAWRIEAQTLRVRVSAPTKGWVLVGFNTKPGLDGAKLIFLRVRAQAEGEVHRTDFRYPAPYHKLRTSIGGSNYLRAIEGAQTEARTTVSAELPLDSGEALDIALKPGRKYHWILAYSTSDDFDHHSIMRTSVDTVLTR